MYEPPRLHQVQASSFYLLKAYGDGDTVAEPKMLNFQGFSVLTKKHILTREDTFASFLFDY